MAKSQCVKPEFTPRPPLHLICSFLHSLSLCLSLSKWPPSTRGPSPKISYSHSPMHTESVTKLRRAQLTMSSIYLHCSIPAGSASLITSISIPRRESYLTDTHLSWSPSDPHLHQRIFLTGKPDVALKA